MTRARLLVCLILPCLASTARSDELADQLRTLDARVIVLGKVRTPPLASMLSRDADARLRQANGADAEAWKKVQTRADWEAFRDVRIKAMRDSLGTFPPPPKDMKMRVTRTLEGDGYLVDNLVYETRPGLVVAANLYRPTKPAASMPGMVITLSHQRPKHDGARQDMGMTWARAGVVVVVPDHLGHGERRQHPFGNDIDAYPHDYHFRYDLGIQLHLAGESLMGWLAYDLMRGVDVLLAQPGVDAKRIIMISEPAGGGDVAAVAAALDPRIHGIMVHNFGGPEPENAYPLARDAEQSFDYAGSGSWESTRNLYRSASDGFLPWTIVASVAPRKLIYYHEFYWDKARDPVWQRLQKVYGFYDAKDNLTGIGGRGFVVGSAPENTHWIPKNRELLYPVLRDWFSVTNPEREYSKRRPPEELLCITPAIAKALDPQPLHLLATKLAAERTTAARKNLTSLSLADRRAKLRKDWAALLGDVDPGVDPLVVDLPVIREQLASARIERVQLVTEAGIVVPLILLAPESKTKKSRPPVVIGLCQEGKQEFLRKHADTISLLLNAGIAVCLPDVRGTGETSASAGRDRSSSATSIASSGLMVGQSTLGSRLRDLRSVLRFLRNRDDLEKSQIALWGDSFAPPNAASVDLSVAYIAEKRPGASEPLGGLLALLGALYEDDVHTVYVHRGLSDFGSVVEGRFRHVPYDVIVPRVLTVGDLCDVVGALSPRPIRLEGLVDGLNREVPTKVLLAKYRPAFDKGETAVEVRAESSDAKEIARWLTTSLRR